MLFCVSVPDIAATNYDIFMQYGQWCPESSIPFPLFGILWLYLIFPFFLYISHTLYPRSLCFSTYVLFFYSAYDLYPYESSWNFRRRQWGSNLASYVEAPLIICDLLRVRGVSLPSHTEGNLLLCSALSPFPEFFFSTSAASLLLDLLYTACIICKVPGL